MRLNGGETMSKAPVIEQERPAESPPAPTPTCQHHWLIETPRGALSRGRCKRCGEERDFRNSTTDYVWDEESSGGYNAWRGVRSSPRSRADDDSVAA